MKTIQISDNNARKLYKDAPDAFRAALVDTFGKDFFSGKITDRIKTYEDACEEIGEKPLDEKALIQLGLTIDEINYRKIKTITKALNEGWEPDWSNSNQKKWYPWFDLSGGGFVFGDASCFCSAACAGNGSRLCLKSDELATYAGKQFTEPYKGFII